MPRLLRIVHDEFSRIPVQTAMSGVPEIPRVYTDGAGTLRLKQVADGRWSHVEWMRWAAECGMIWHQDLMSGAAKFHEHKYGEGIAALAGEMIEAGYDPVKIMLISDWERWSKLRGGNAQRVAIRLGDFNYWHSQMRFWPGPIGNYGNAEGAHVEEHPGNEVALSWPWLKDIPRNRGVSVPVMYPPGGGAGSLGLSINGLRKTLAVARSGRLRDFRWRRPARPTVVLIKDPRDYKPGEFDECLAAAATAGVVVFWGTSPTAEGTEFSFSDRVAQDRIIAESKQVKKWLAAAAIGRVS